MSTRESISVARPHPHTSARFLQPNAAGVRAEVLFVLVLAASLIIIRASTAVTLLDGVGFLLCFGSIPFVVGRNRPLAILLLSMCLCVLGIVGSDQLNGVPVRDTMSSLAFPVLISIAVLTVPFLAGGNQRAMKAGVAAGVFSHLAYELLHENPFFTTSPWKFGLAAPVILLTLMICTALPGRAAPILLLLGFAAFSATQDFRSMAAICLAAALVIFFQGTAAGGVRRYGRGRLSIVIGAAVLVTVSAYSWAAGGGHLGRDAQYKYERQTASGNVLFAGRPEVIPSLVAIEHAPLIGLGSTGNLPPDQEAEALQRMALAGADTSAQSQERIFGQAAYNAHSQALGGWALSGVLGVAPWLTIIVLSLRAMAKTSAGHSWQPVIAFWGLLITWNSLFSPHERHEQVMIGGFLLLATLGDWKSPKRLSASEANKTLV